MEEHAMKVSLKEIADITQGNILTRIKSDKGTMYRALTMQQLSYYINSSDMPGEFNSILVEENKQSNLCIAEEGDLIVGLNSGKAMTIRNELAGSLIVSNFIRIRLNDRELYDPDFLCWLFNENEEIQRYLYSFTQGTARVAIIPLSNFKDIEILQIPIEAQRKIGRVYQLQRRTIRISREKNYLKSKLYKIELLSIYKNGGKK